MNLLSFLLYFDRSQCHRGEDIIKNFVEELTPNFGDNRPCCYQMTISFEKAVPGGRKRLAKPIDRLIFRHQV